MITCTVGLSGRTLHTIGFESCGGLPATIQLLHPFNQLFRQLAALSTASPRMPKGWCRILTGSAIGLAVRLSLRTRLTLIRLALIRSLSLCGGVSHPTSLWTPTFCFSTHPAGLAPPSTAEWNAHYWSLYDPTASVNNLIPDYYPAKLLDLSCTHSLNGWLLPSQHPSCLGILTSLV